MKYQAHASFLANKDSFPTIKIVHCLSLSSIDTIGVYRFLSSLLTSLMNEFKVKFPIFQALVL